VLLQLVQRPVDGAHDLARVCNPAEREVEIGTAGGVEVDRAHAQHPLQHRLARVDVLDALQAGLVTLPPAIRVTIPAIAPVSTAAKKPLM
jgi:hypothetical protein